MALVYPRASLPSIHKLTGRPVPLAHKILVRRARLEKPSQHEWIDLHLGRRWRGGGGVKLVLLFRAVSHRQKKAATTFREKYLKVVFAVAFIERRSQRAYSSQLAGLSVVVVQARGRVGGETLDCLSPVRRGLADLGGAWIQREDVEAHIGL